MTLPTSGTLSLDAINSEFNLGRNLAAYRGVKWYKDDNSRGYFDNSSTGNFPPIDFFEFYGTRKTITVTPETINPASTGYRTIQFYNTMSFNLATGTTGGTGGDGSSWYGWDPNQGWYTVYGSGGGAPGPSTITWGSYTYGSSQSDNATATLLFDAENNIVRLNGSVLSNITPPLRGSQIYISVGAAGTPGPGGAGTRTTGSAGSSGNPGSISFQIA
jgi:hypothetical protein